MRGRFSLTQFRWLIAGLLLAVTMINCTDRLTLATLAARALLLPHPRSAEYERARQKANSYQYEGRAAPGSPLLGKCTLGGGSGFSTEP